MSRLRSWLAVWGPAVGAHLFLLAAWHFGVVWGEVPAYMVPPPLAALATILEPHYNWMTHVLTTSAEVLLGYVLAVGIGIALAVVFHWFSFLNRSAMPVLITLNMVPKVALAPLFIVWFSYGIGPNAIIAFTICFFPVVLTTERGLREVEPELIELARSLKATRWQVFLKIQLPGSLPYIFSGMRLAAILAIVGAVVGEFVGSNKGLGYLLLTAQGALDTAAMFMAIVMISLVGVVLYWVVLLLERAVVVRDARIG